MSTATLVTTLPSFTPPFTLLLHRLIWSVNWLGRKWNNSLFLLLLCCVGGLLGGSGPWPGLALFIFRSCVSSGGAPTSAGTSMFTMNISLWKGGGGGGGGGEGSLIPRPCTNFILQATNTQGLGTRLGGGYIISLKIRSEHRWCSKNPCRHSSIHYTNTLVLKFNLATS